MRGLVITLVLAIAGVATGPACSQAPGAPTSAPAGHSSSQARVPGEYLVVLAAGADAKAIVDLYGQYGIESIRKLGRNAFLLTVTNDPGPETMADLSKQSVHVEAVQPNYVYRSQGRFGSRQ